MSKEKVKYHEVEIKGLGKVKMRFPNIEETRQADWEYSKVFFQAIKDGIPTRREMDNVIRDHNIFDDNYNKEYSDIMSELGQLYLKLNDAITEEEKNIIQYEINDAKDRLLDLQYQRQSFYNNTAESKAEQAKLTYLIWKCTEWSDKKERVWDKLDDFKCYEDQNVLRDVISEYMILLNGIEDEKIINEIRMRRNPELSEEKSEEEQIQNEQEQEYKKENINDKENIKQKKTKKEIIK